MILLALIVALATSCTIEPSTGRPPKSEEPAADVEDKSESENPVVEQGQSSDQAPKSEGPTVDVEDKSESENPVVEQGQSSDQAHIDQTNEVMEILATYSCAGCHSSQEVLDLRQFPFGTDDARSQEDLVDEILDRVARTGFGKMPPNPNQSLTQDEFNIIQRWRDAGMGLNESTDSTSEEGRSR